MIIALFLAAAPVVDDTYRQENYETMLSCAAFHTIEATRGEASATEAQQAVAYDFAASAVRFAPDGKVETANADLEKMLSVFRQKLDTGDVRAIAEGWTSLGGACRKLYPVRDELGKDKDVEAEASR